MPKTNSGINLEYEFQITFPFVLVQMKADD